MIQSFNIIKSNNLINKDNVIIIINKLPIDIVKIIYINYIKPSLICTELNIILKSYESQKLNNIPLYDYLINNNILQNKIVIKYLLKNDEIFHNIYQDHIINEIQTFEQFPDIISSLAACWLMYLYH